MNSLLDFMSSTSMDESEIFGEVVVVRQDKSDGGRFPVMDDVTIGR